MAYFSAEDSDMTKPKAKVVVSKKAIKKSPNPAHLKLDETHEEAPVLVFEIHDPTVWEKFKTWWESL